MYEAFAYEEIKIFITSWHRTYSYASLEIILRKIFEISTELLSNIHYIIEYTNWQQKQCLFL